MPVCIVKCQSIHYSSAAFGPPKWWGMLRLETAAGPVTKSRSAGVHAGLAPGNVGSARFFVGMYVFGGARTFLSAASPEREHGSDLLPASAKHVAADRNVRAPRYTDTGERDRVRGNSPSVLPAVGLMQM